MNQNHIDGFLDILRVKGLNEKTIRLKRGILRKYDAFLADSGVTNITKASPADVERYASKVLEGSYAKSSGHPRRKIGTVKEFYCFLTANGHLLHDPSGRIAARFGLQIERSVPNLERIHLRENEFNSG